MDIDTEPSLETYSHFSLVFPLPYRCLFLIGVGILGWAANLQGLYFLGVDTGYALDIHRKNALRETGDVTRTPSIYEQTQHAHPGSLYKPVYRVFMLFGSFAFSSWLLFQYLIAGTASGADSVKIIPTITFIVIIAIIVCPFPILHAHERFTFLRATWRCLSPPRSQPIYFSDVVLADIFTSFAKVFGDIWLALRILFAGHHLWLSPPETGLSQWIIPCLMSLPYGIRFRQCIVEYLGTKSSRSLMNAAKYATAFPVIFLSAAQRLVDDAPTSKGSTKHGEHPLFRLWVLSVFVNSAYSFWWDISNDWGLDLLKFSSTRPSRSSGGIQLQPTPLATPPLTRSPKPHSHSLSDEGRPQQPQHSYKGLRAKLLFSDPTIYYFAIFINFVLRFTWSLKLSSHLHHVADLEVGVFMMEALEVLRRWIWVFLRVEWEIVRPRANGHTYNGNPEEYEFLMREAGDTDLSDVASQA